MAAAAAVFALAATPALASASSSYEPLDAAELVPSLQVASVADEETSPPEALEVEFSLVELVHSGEDRDIWVGENSDGHVCIVATSKESTNGATGSSCTLPEDFARYGVALAVGDGAESSVEQYLLPTGVNSSQLRSMNGVELISLPGTDYAATLVVVTEPESFPRNAPIEMRYDSHLRSVSASVFSLSPLSR